jgi:hypothetical protein
LILRHGGYLKMVRREKARFSKIIMRCPIRLLFTYMLIGGRVSPLNWVILSEKSGRFLRAVDDYVQRRYGMLPGAHTIRAILLNPSLYKMSVHMGAKSTNQSYIYP